jgi:hypothetical protein
MSPRPRGARRAEPAPHELALQRLQDVLDVVLLDVEVLVAGHPERVVLEHLHAGEQQSAGGRR